MKDTFFEKRCPFLCVFFVLKKITYYAKVEFR